MPYKDPIKRNEAKRKSYLKYKDTEEYKKKKAINAKTYKKKHTEEYLTYMRAYWKKPENRKRKTIKEQKSRWKAKGELYKHFGSVCVSCGFTDARALQIDHINNDGRLDREKFKTNMAYYWYLLKQIRSGEDIRNRYQLLCANCNFIKMWEVNNYQTI